MSIKERFKKYDREFNDFKKVQVRLSSRPDLHAFILLNKLVPSTENMIRKAELDQVWLDVDPDRLDLIITDEQVRELSLCGLHWCDHSHCLSIFT